MSRGGAAAACMAKMRTAVLLSCSIGSVLCVKHDSVREVLDRSRQQSNRCSFYDESLPYSVSLYQQEQLITIPAVCTVEVTVIYAC